MTSVNITASQVTPTPPPPRLPFFSPMPDMALVAPPISSISMSSLPLHYALNGGASLSPGASSPPLVNTSTPLPPSDTVSQQSSDNESAGAKDENGQDIV